MTSKVKKKGNSWERELCVFLGKELNGNWTRVPNSGAFIGGKNSYRINNLSATQERAAKGDIIPPDHLSKIVLECKFYKEFSFHSIVVGEPNAQLDTWISQAKSGVKEDEQWFLCVKINRKGKFIVFPNEYNYNLEQYSIYKNKQGLFKITNLEDFFKSNKDKILNDLK